MTQNRFSYAASYILGLKMNAQVHFYDSLLLSCTPSPFLKGVYSKRKQIAPFSFRVYPFSEGSKTILSVASPEGVSTLFKQESN